MLLLRHKEPTKHQQIIQILTKSQFSEIQAPLLERRT